MEELAPVHDRIQRLSHGRFIRRRVNRREKESDNYKFNDKCWRGSVKDYLPFLIMRDILCV